MTSKFNRNQKWVSAGHPKCNHEGEYRDFCQVCGYPMELSDVSLELLY
jgi:hypothetical protein